MWKRGCFGWENKKPGRDLGAALKQLTDYALQLDNPPLLVVCDRERIVHFLVQCLFCMFAEDEALLPENIFTDILGNAGTDTAKAANRIGKLFGAMQKKSGGEYGDHDIAWFNGGLFQTIDIPELTTDDVAALHRAAADRDWRAIDPTIFGTLFERGLDPKARAPLGAHYTDTGTIAKLIHPLITEPLLAEWREVKAIIAAGQGKGPRSKAFLKARAACHGFLQRLFSFRVLDPACGSGNFLYLALKALRDVEKQVNIEAQDLGYPAKLLMMTGPQNICGIEINEYAAELARTTVWIGDIQWCRRNGREIARDPILRSLDSIEHRDALLNPDGSEASWPKAHVIVGNPPFLGDKMMRGELGDDSVERLRGCYQGRVPGGADLVTYWFEKARAQIEAGLADAAGLVATNSIRQKRNRVVLERIQATTRIFEAWSDEDWVNEGAAVRVSLVCFGRGNTVRLDGQPLAANKGRSFFGICLAGPFKVDTATALDWLADTGNPNGRPNSDVVRPIYNGSDITRRWAGKWVIDFAAMDQRQAADYLKPFAHVEAMVKPVRINNNRVARAEKWWQHGEKRPALRAALQGLSHYIATPETAKHRFFVRFPVQVAPEHSLIVIPRQDDATLGILSSRIHCLWAIEKGGRMGLGNDPRYNASLTFETFPFPPGFDLHDPAPPAGEPLAAIGAAAAELLRWREHWLNPEEWLDWVITPEEQAAGLPPRPQPKPEHAAAWKKRTLTNLYNEMPAGLRLRQEQLDRAVALAYGWDDYSPAMPDPTILARLLARNLAPVSVGEDRARA